MSIVHTPRASTRTFRTAALLAAACSLVAAADTRAATKTFSTAGTNWLDGPSWTPAGVPTATDDVLINAGTAAMTLNASPLTIQYITFSNPSSRVLGNSTTDATNSTLTLDGNGGANPLISVTGTGVFTVRGPNNSTGTGTLGLVLNASGDLNVNAGGGLNISSVISETGGARAITKTGAGALTLSGANTFTGDFTLGGGTVTITSLANAGTAQSLGMGAGTVSLGGGGTLVYTGAATSTDRTFAISSGGATISNANDVTLTGTTTAAGAVTKTGAGALILSGATTALTGAPSITITGGTLRLDNGTNLNADRIGNATALTLNAGRFQVDNAPGEVVGNLNLTGGANAVAGGGVSFSGLSRTAGVVAFEPGTGDFNFAAAPALSNGIIGAWATHGLDWATVDGSNNVVAYAGYNTGDTNTWTATDNADAAVNRTVAANTTVNTLRVNDGATVTVDPGATLNVGGGILAPAQVGSPTISGGGSVTAGSVAGHEMIVTVASAANTLTVGAPIVNNGGGATKLVKAGAGGLLIDAASTYSGDTDVLAGSLRFGASGSIANSTVNLPSGGGTIDTNGQNPTIGGLTGANGIVLNGGSLSIGANGSTTTYSGVFSGTGAITKVGTGTLSLTGANTFTGSVNVGATSGGGAGGTLNVNADSRFGAAGNGINIYNGTLRLADGTGVTTVVTSGGPAGVVGLLVGIGRPVTVNHANSAVEVPTGQYAELPGTISGTGVLRKTGGGILDLRTSNNGNNAYTGGTIVEGGTLGIVKDGNLGAAGAPVEIRNNAIIEWYSNAGAAGLLGRTLTIGAGGGTVEWGLSSGVPLVNHQIASSAGNTLTKFGTNTVQVNVAQPNMNGDLHVGQGRLNTHVGGAAGNGTIRLNAPDINPATAAGVAQLGIGGTNLGLTVTLTNNIVLNPTGQGAVSFEVNNSTPTQNNLILNGTISGTGGLTKGRVANTSGILTLGGNNTYTGQTTVLFGTLQVSDNSNLGAAANGITLGGSAAAATLRTTGIVSAAGRAVTLASGGGVFDTIADATFGDVTGTANMTKNGAAQLTVNRVRSNNLTVNAGTLVIAPNGTATGMVEASGVVTVAGGALLHMNDNDMIVNYTGTSPEFALRDKVLLYRNGAGTEGIGFTETVAEDTILAFGEASELAITSFQGVTIDNTTIVGKYTYYGDGNLDGQVTTDDYVAVDLGLGTGDSWVQGDFDLNGVVTTDDYVVVDLNLGKGTSNPLAYAETQAEMIALHTEMFGQSYVEKLAYASEFGWVAASVPEPGALSLVGLGAMAMLGRRRRRE